MVGVWHGDLERLTRSNVYFRRVLFTGVEQLALMSLGVGEEIGDEVHPDSDQFFRVEKGSLKFVINGGRQVFVEKSGGAVIVPKGTYHNVINVGKSVAKLYVIYAPPTHKAGTVNKNKPKGD